jgi:DNA-binding LytR/AlgR family response regulator
MRASALIAEDEPLLRAQLRETLAEAWPELDIVAEVEDGVDALAALVTHRPDVAFLDIRMPGTDGLAVARAAAGRCHVIFLTAYDEYAVQAFDHGAVDYLLKPIDPGRVALALERLKSRMAQASLPPDITPVVRQLSTTEPTHLRWIHASCGMHTRILDAEQIAGFVADAKYTRIIGVGADTHIRKTIKELATELNEAQFCQISRSAVVNLAHVQRVTRDGSGGMKLTVAEVELTVTQPYQGRFRQM